MPARKGLSDKQQLFVQEYLVDLNATAAAERAGYRQPNQQGPRLLVNVGVKAAIDRAMQGRRKRLEISADRVLQELAAVAFSDLRHFVSWGPGSVELKRCEDLPEEQAAAVAEVVQTQTETGGTTRLKLHSKVNALDKLCRHLGLYQQADPDQVDDRQVDEWLERRLHSPTTGGPGPPPPSGSSPTDSPDATPKTRPRTARKSSAPD